MIKIKLPVSELEVLSDILSDGIPTIPGEDPSICDHLNDADDGRYSGSVEVELSEKDISQLFYYIQRHNHLYSPLSCDTLEDWYRYCEEGK